MSWLKLHDSFGNDPKLRRLSRRLGVCEAQADGHASNLWAWCLLHAKDGDLSTKDPEDIAVAAKWEGDPDVLISAMVACRLLDADPLSIHNWMERQGSWKAAVRQQKYRASKPVTPPLHNGRTQRGEEREERRHKRGVRTMPPAGGGAVTQETQKPRIPKTPTEPSEAFLHWWKIWRTHSAHVEGSGPGGRGKAWEAWQKSTNQDVAFVAARNYLADCEVIGAKTQHGATWLNGDWAEWLEREPRNPPEVTKGTGGVDMEKFTAVAEAMKRVHNPKYPQGQHHLNPGELVPRALPDSTRHVDAEDPDPDAGSRRLRGQVRGSGNGASSEAGSESGEDAPVVGDASGVPGGGAGATTGGD